jgi:hypothetical protein
MPPIPPTSSSTKPAPLFALAKGNTALITGGASGIGLAIAHICRKRGMRVGVVDQNVELLDRAKQDLAHGSPEEVDFYQVDVSQEKQWKMLANDVKQRFGDVDFLVLNAGVGGKGDWGDGEYFQRVCWFLIFFDYEDVELFHLALLKLQTRDTGADTEYLDIPNQSLRRHQRPQHLCPSLPLQVHTQLHRHNRQQTRHHKPTRQSRLQRIQSGG